MGNYITGGPPDRGARSEEGTPRVIEPGACWGQAEARVHAADAAVRY